MKKEDELKLRGVPLQRRIEHHEKVYDRLLWPFLVGFVTLIFGVILLRFDEPRIVFWFIICLAGLVLVLASLYMASWHQKRANELDKLAQDNPVVLPSEEA